MEKVKVNIPRISPPEDWIDEELRSRCPEQLKLINTPLNPIMLDICVWKSLEDFASSNSIDLDDVKHSLSAGCELIRKRRTEVSFDYKLRSSEYSLSIRPGIGQKTGNPLASFVSVEAEDYVIDPSRMIQVTLIFVPIWDEPKCDLDATYTVIQERMQAAAFIKKSRDEIIAGIHQTQLIKVDETLHKLALKEYGALRLLLQLLHIRDELLPQTSADGIVLTVESDDKDSATTIDLEISNVTNGQFRDDDQVVLVESGSDREYRGTVEEFRNSQITIVTKGTLKLVAGSRVHISEKPRYQYGRHEESLRAFLRKEAAGCWEDLVTLLCKPDRLPGIQATMPETWFSEHDLNKEQRAAVAGALSSPSAFFIQGPPGTGKTSVICEIIEQLASKGESVLLVASTHVAVDEVLRRIGRKDGIFPLRIAWDPGRVDKDLRFFTFQHLSKHLTSKVAAGAVRQGTLLGKKLDDIKSIAGGLEALNDLRLKRDESERTMETASAHRDHFYVDIDRQIKGHEDQIVSFTNAVDSCRRSVASQKGRLNSASTQLDAVLKTKQSLLGKVLSSIGGDIAHARSELNNARKKLDQAQSSLQGVEESLAKEQKSLKASMELRESKGSELDIAKSMAQEGFEGAKWAWESALAASPYHDSQHVERALQDLEEMKDSTRKLEAYKALNEGLCKLLDSDKVTSESESNNLDDLSGFLLQGVNLFCATTEGIAGSPHAKDHTFDTLIVDESSRVTDAQFLISAIRARRWILVGDENQLPPYFGNKDEYLLHALCALLMRENLGVSVDSAVDRLASIWENEDDSDLHEFRREAVRKEAEQLLSSGLWEREFKDILAEQQEYYISDDENTDLSEVMLSAMKEKLVTCPRSQVHPLSDSQRRFQTV
ncbi:MAG: AAA family ATPase [Acidobacteria bacterium]|nr:AAA family ATPase [Acidobacteriota bacterium]